MHIVDSTLHGMFQTMGSPFRLDSVNGRDCCALARIDISGGTHSLQSRVTLSNKQVGLKPKQESALQDYWIFCTGSSGPPARQGASGEGNAVESSSELHHPAPGAKDQTTATTLQSCCFTELWSC